jgi:hypothetical protein
MGYRREPRIINLRFEDTEYDGLVVRARSVSTGEFFAFQDLAEHADRRSDSARDLIALFATVVIDWNLEDPVTGEPMPVSDQVLLDQDLDFVMDLVITWMDAVAGVTRPLGRASTGGRSSPEASLPMEISSANRPS